MTFLNWGGGVHKLLRRRRSFQSWILTKGQFESESQNGARANRLGAFKPQCKVEHSVKIWAKSLKNWVFYGRLKFWLFSNLFLLFTRIHSHRAPAYLEDFRKNSFFLWFWLKIPDLKSLWHRDFKFSRGFEKLGCCFLKNNVVFFQETKVLQQKAARAR